MLSASRPSSSTSKSDASESSSAASFWPEFGTNCAWKCSSDDTSFTVAPTLSFLDADERFQNKGKVVDIAKCRLQEQNFFRKEADMLTAIGLVMHHLME